MCNILLYLARNLNEVPDMFTHWDRMGADILQEACIVHAGYEQCMLGMNGACWARCQDVDTKFGVGKLIKSE